MKDQKIFLEKLAKENLGGSLFFSSSLIILHPSSLFHHFLENKENFLNKNKLNKKKLKQFALTSFIINYLNSSITSVLTPSFSNPSIP